MKILERINSTKEVSAGTDYIIHHFKTSKYDSPMYKDAFSLETRLVLFVTSGDGLDAELDIVDWIKCKDELLTLIDN